MSQINQQQAEFNKNKNIVLLCQSRMRSNKAAKTFKKWGFNKVTNVKGGITTWKN